MARGKPVSSSPASELVPGASALPYPTSPSTAKMPSSFDERTPQKAHQSGAEDEPGPQNVWASGAIGGFESLPASLRAGGGKQAEHMRNVADISESLRVGAPCLTPRSSSETERPTILSTNPYITRQQTSQSTGSDGRESSANAWEVPSEKPPRPLDTPPPPPVPKGEQLVCSSVEL
jgi:hypothetical protein